MVTNGYGVKQSLSNDLGENVRTITELNRRGQPYNASRINCMIEINTAFNAWCAVCIVESIEAKVKEWRG